MQHSILFKNRSDAGRQLARRLTPFRHRNPIVLGLPRGGVIVAYDIARAFRTSLNVVIPRGSDPVFQPKRIISGVVPGTLTAYDQDLGVAAAEPETRLRFLHCHAELPDVEDRTVILVDDGISTGQTAQAAIETLRRAQPRRLVLAVPIAAPEAAARIGRIVDDFVCLAVPTRLITLGHWYVDFNPVSDEDVEASLARARREISVVRTSRPLATNMATDPAGIASYPRTLHANAS